MAGGLLKLWNKLSTFHKVEQSSILEAPPRHGTDNAKAKANVEDVQALFRAGRLAEGFHGFFHWRGVCQEEHLHLH